MSEPKRCAVSGHGYNAYTHGCRCGVCRQAKADYMRAARKRGRERAAKLTVSSTGKRPARHNAWAPGSSRALVVGVKHGRHAYEVHGCRCRECTTAHRLSHVSVAASVGGKRRPGASGGSGSVGGDPSPRRAPSAPTSGAGRVVPGPPRDANSIPKP